MKKNKILPVLVSFVLLLVPACSDYVDNVDPLIDLAKDDLLNSEAQMDFLSKGVQQRFATIADQLACLMDLQSDQMIYTAQIPTASFPTFEEIDKGQILLDNATVQGAYQAVGQLRKYADDLVRRVGAVTFSDQTKKNSALYIGNLYGGIARYYLGCAFALTQNQPGGTIDAGPFISQSQLFDDAVAKMNAALAVQSDAAQLRIVNSLIAKVYLSKQDYANAATYAAKGMAKNDPAFQALHNDISNIYYWGFAGAGRVQIAVSSRFNNYVVTDPKETNRIKLGTVTGRDNVKYYYQLKYPDKTNNFPIMTWQENSLMLAECALRGSGTGNALALVNDVRTSHSLDPAASIDISGVLVERDKELFVQGARLTDQLRTNAWHLAADVWRYMPIPRNERNANPNLPPQ